MEDQIPYIAGNLKGNLEIARQIVKDERLLTKKGIRSAVDPDARFGRKSDSKSFYGYKNHIAMTEEEIITDLVVTSGNEDDGKQLQPLVNNSRKKHLTIKEVFADTAYSSKDNLSFLQTENIKANIPLNPIVYGQRKDDLFRYDKECDKVICPAGHYSIRRTKKNPKNRSAYYIYYFDTAFCQKCPFQEGCYNNTKQKSYHITIKTEEHKKQMAYLESEEYKQRKGTRKRIEHKNAELKNAHGMTRAKYRGQFGMKIQAFLTAFTVNVKRMIKLQEAH